MRIKFTVILALCALSSFFSQEKSHITEFEALIRNDAVILTWKGSHNSEDLLLYRSTSPFLDIQSLSQAVIVSTKFDSALLFVDYPIPGIPYYYAIIDETNLAQGTILFEAGINTNRVPVEISHLYSNVPKQKTTYQRPIPLPWLNPQNKQQEKSYKFSETTEEDLKRYTEITQTKQKYKKNFVVLSDDLNTSFGGEYLLLRNILNSSIKKKEWDKATQEFKDFLKLRRTQDSIARAHFYLGQCYYFQSEPEKALLEFLLAQDTYYDKSQEWIQYTLQLLANNS